MKSMISRILCSEGAKYSWVYIPHSYDEQFDVIAIPDDANLDLDWLFVNSDAEPDSSLELGEHPHDMMDMTPPLPPNPDLSDTAETEPRQGDLDINTTKDSAQSSVQEGSLKGQVL